jgi:carbon storage regulator CsrA
VIVIPRKKGQRVVIDDEIILTVIEIRRDRVRLRVELPKGVSVQKPGGIRGDPRREANALQLIMN